MKPGDDDLQPDQEQPQEQQLQQIYQQIQQQIQLQQLQDRQIQMILQQVRHIQHQLRELNHPLHQQQQELQSPQLNLPQILQQTYQDPMVVEEQVQNPNPNPDPNFNRGEGSDGNALLRDDIAMNAMAGLSSPSRPTNYDLGDHSSSAKRKFGDNGAEEMAKKQRVCEDETMNDMAAGPSTSQPRVSNEEHDEIHTNSDEENKHL